MFKLDNLVSISFQKKKIIGRIVGIDFYKLDSFDGRSCKWPSYTLVSDAKGIFSRYWFVCWDKSRWILWTSARKKTLPAQAKFIYSKSGIGQIGFTGDSGASTPVAALSQYKVEKKYFCLERFANSETMLFDGWAIKKPLVISKEQKS